MQKSAKNYCNLLEKVQRMKQAKKNLYKTAGHMGGYNVNQLMKQTTNPKHLKQMYRDLGLDWDFLQSLSSPDAKKEGKSRNLAGITPKSKGPGQSPSRTLQPLPNYKYDNIPSAVGVTQATIRRRHKNDELNSPPGGGLWPHQKKVH